MNIFKQESYIKKGGNLSDEQVHGFIELYPDYYNYLFSHSDLKGNRSRIFNYLKTKNLTTFTRDRYYQEFLNYTRDSSPVGIHKKPHKKSHKKSYKKKGGVSEALINKRRKYLENLKYLFEKIYPYFITYLKNLHSNTSIDEIITNANEEYKFFKQDFLVFKSEVKNGSIYLQDYDKVVYSGQQSDIGHVNVDAVNVDAVNVDAVRELNDENINLELHAVEEMLEGNPLREASPEPIGNPDRDGSPFNNPPPYLNQGGNVIKNAFDDFLRQKASLTTGGEDVEVREGYDSFTIVHASAGNVGGRFISKTPYTAASKAASRLFKDTKSSSLTFVMQKTTNGSNKRYYAYEATIKYLSKPMLIFKNDEQGNKIVMNTYGQVLRINKNKKVVNSSNNNEDYNPNEKISSLTTFNYKPYIIKEVTKDITIKAIEVPYEYKEKQMEKAKNKMTEEQKEMMKQKKAEKKAREGAKKAAEKEKEKARKEKERERARRQKEKEREQIRKEKLRNKKMMLKGGSGMCSLNTCM